MIYDSTWTKHSGNVLVLPEVVYIQIDDLPGITEFIIDDKYTQGGYTTYWIHDKTISGILRVLDTHANKYAYLEMNKKGYHKLYLKFNFKNKK